MPDNALLTVEDLSVTFAGAAGPSVRNLTFSIAPNETVAVVGESGSGKSTTALALLGLLPDGAHVSGSAQFDGADVLTCGEKALRGLRGSRIAYVPQNPFGSLNPLFTAGEQILEAIRAHDPRLDRRSARERAIELIDAVGIDNPPARYDAYPHQLSGGMRQRVVIAMALANRPALIIADEPTSALDVTVQAQVLEALEDARRISGASLLLISHDLGVVARHADRVLVMYGGGCVEHGPVDEVFTRPRMPYAKGLLGAVPRADVPGDTPLVRMSPPPGPIPSAGCPFAPRCPAVEDPCRTDRPALIDHGNGHEVACIRADEIGHEPAIELFASTASRHPSRIERPRGEAPILIVRDLVKHFDVGRRKHRAQVHAVCGISVDVRPGESLAIVGESGSGKTTLNRTLIRMEEPTSGSITLDGVDLTRLSARALRPFRRRLQMVLQDSTASLNPKLTVDALISEPLAIHGHASSARVDDLLRLAGLPATMKRRLPAELSGGQRQRVAIARGLAVEPDVLVLDEPVSALDVSVQAEILALLRDLRNELGVAYIFVTHDLGVLRHAADRVAVMYLGRLVEVGDVASVLSKPQHPYTQALMSAVPVPDPMVERERGRIVLEGEVPSAQDPPSGCRFRTRCPLFRNLGADDQTLCIERQPELRGGQQQVACHHTVRPAATKPEPPTALILH